MAHIRLLSWLLLGSVNHTLRYGGNVGGIAASEVIISQPIPLDASCHIADHIQVILAGFAGEGIHGSLQSGINFPQRAIQHT